MLWTEESIAFLRDAAAINRYYETIAERIAPQLPENAHICDAGLRHRRAEPCSEAVLPSCHGGGRGCAGHQNAESPPDRGRHRALRRYGDACAREALRRDGVLSLWPHAGRAAHCKKQCRGRIFLVKRDYSHHRFSAGKVSLGEYTAGSTENVLREKGIPYTVERFTAEFGQPFRSLEAAERFFALYNRSKSEVLSKDEIRARLTAGPSEKFPYYLPHEKALCLFTVETADIPEKAI